jgi:hypothetical protein
MPGAGDVRLGRRITALAVRGDGALVAGTFDDGVFRVEPPKAKTGTQPVPSPFRGCKGVSDS